jgi:hypothetical protein
MPITAINKAPMCGVKLSEFSLEIAQAACDQAIAYLTQAIYILRQETLTQEQSELVIKYFIPDGGDNQIRQSLIDILTLTLDGLRDTGITLTIDNFNSAKKGSPIIHIAPLQFRNTNQLVRFMIHEATHVFAGTKDFADYGYVNNDGEFRRAGIARESALNNADSYAVFTVLCANLPLV